MTGCTQVRRHTMWITTASSGARKSFAVHPPAALGWADGFGLFRCGCLLFLAGIATMPLAAQLRQNGTKWILTESGSIRVGRAETVRMELFGALDLGPAEPGDTRLTYQIEAETENASRDEARRRLAGIRMVSEATPELISVGLLASVRQRDGLRVRVRIPSSVKTFKIRQLGGSLAVRNLRGKDIRANLRWRRPF